MVELSTDEIRRLMGRPDYIRNISLIFERDHQSPSITDVLVGDAGISLCQSTDGSFRHDRSESATEAQHIHDFDAKYLPVPLYAQVLPEDGPKVHTDETSTDEFFINMIDCSDCVSLTPDGNCSAVRNTDGVILVLDFMKGMSLQAEKVLRQALAGSLRPMVFIDNLEYVLHDTELPLEEIYQQCVKLIDSVNSVILQYRTYAVDDTKLSPTKDNVIFGSTKHKWAFTIGQFARKYAKKFDVDQLKMCKRLWGDSFFHTTDKRWHRSGDQKQRAFNQFVLEPIHKIYSAYKRGDPKDLAELATKLWVALSLSEQEQSPSNLLQTVMHGFLPFTNTFMESMVKYLPSPIAAQQHRARELYCGSPEDEIYRCIKECDPTADLMFSVSNVVPSKEKRTSYVIGRVYAGTVRPGSKVRVQGENYIPGRKEDLFVKRIESTVLMMGQNVTSIMEVPAGNYACLVGLSDFVNKGATITTHDSAQNMKWSSCIQASTVQCSVDVVDANNLPELISGLKMLAKCDTSIDVSITPSGDHVIRGCNEQHLKVRSKELEGHYAGVPLKVSEPFVGYRESVRQQSSMTALSKTPNKFSRFWVTAEPLNEDLSRAIEERKITPSTDFKARAQVLATDYGWNEIEARKIWAFGPYNHGANLVVDMTKHVQYLAEIKDSFISGFEWASREGPLAEEPMRSIRFNILDVGLFSDAIHRGGGQIIPTARRVTYAATLLADPVLMEPVYHVEIHTPTDSVTQITSKLVKRRGKIVSQQVQTGVLESLSLIKAYLPVVESFGLNDSLNEDIVTPVSSNIIFDHWQAIPGSPWDLTTMAGKIATDVRSKKGLNEPLPDYTKFCDKL